MSSRFDARRASMLRLVGRINPAVITPSGSTGSYTISAMVRRPSRTDDHGVIGREVTALVAAADFTGGRGDTLAWNGETFRVEAIRPDGAGLMSLQLDEAS